MNIQKLSRHARSIFSLNRFHEYQRLCILLELKPTDSILDIGSGDGFWTSRIASYCEKVYGLEPDDTLRGYAKDLYPHPKVQYIAGTAENIPCADSTFSKIISISCFEHFADQDVAMQEIRRVLKPQGIAALSIDSLLPENSSEEFRNWHRQKHYVTRYFTSDELQNMFERNDLAYDAQATTTLFHSRLAGQMRQIYIRHTKLLLPLFPIVYAGVRLSDTLLENQPGQIIILRAYG